VNQRSGRADPGVASAARQKKSRSGNDGEGDRQPRAPDDRRAEEPALLTADDEAAEAALPD